MQALHGAVYHSLRRVFADVIVTPGDQSYFFASTRGGFLTADAAELARRWEKQAVPVKYFGPYYIEAILLPERVEFVRQSCESAPKAINRDFRPVGYYYDVAVAGLAEGLLPPGAATRLRWLPGPVLAAVAVVLFGVPLALSRRGQRLRRGAIIGGVAAAGLAGMTLEVSLLFALQVINGHVYAQVGALIGAFMAGLALGTWTQERARRRGGRPARRWLVWLAAGAVAAAVAPGLVIALASIPGMGAWLPGLTIAALMAAGGAVVGALFPIAVHLLGGSARAAGAVYAADLAGAALGACVAAVIALPLLGLPGACYSAAAMVGAIAVVGAFAVRPRGVS
jgi:spermidine synthase